MILATSVGDLVVTLRADISNLESRIATARRGLESLGGSASRASTVVEASFEKLGVRAEKDIDKARQGIQRAFDEIKNSGTASARDVAAAQQALTRQLRSLDRELNASAGGFRQWGETIRQQIVGLKTSIGQGIGIEIGQRLTSGLLSSLSAIPSALGAATSAAGDYEAAIKSISILGGLEGQPQKLAAIREEIDRLAIASSKGPIELGNLSVELIKTGFSADQVKESLGGIVTASQATGEALQPVGNIIGAALNQFQLSAKDSTRIADILVAGANSSATSILGLGEALSYVGSTASANNQSIDDTVILISALSNAGIDASRAGTNLQQFIQRLSTASAESVTQLDLSTKGIDSQAEALATLGVSVRDSSGRLRSLVSLLPELRTGFQKLGEGDRQIVSKVLFGDEGGRAALSLLNQTEEKFQAVVRAVRTSQGIGDRTSTLQQATGLNSAIALLGGSIQSLQVKLGEAFAPFAEAGIRTLSQVINELLKVQTLFAGLKSAAAQFVEVLNSDPRLVQALASSVEAGAVIVFRELGDAAKEFVEYLNSNKTAITQFIVDGVRSLTSLTKLFIDGVVFVAKFHKEIGLVVVALTGLQAVNTVVVGVQALIFAFQALTPVALASLTALALNPLTWVAGAVVAVGALAYVFRDELLPAINASLSELSVSAQRELASTGDKFANFGEAIKLAVKNPIDSLRNEWSLFLPELSKGFRVWALNTEGTLSTWYQNFANFIDNLKKGLDGLLQSLGLLGKVAAPSLPNPSTAKPEQTKEDAPKPIKSTPPVALPKKAIAQETDKPRQQIIPNVPDKILQAEQARLLEIENLTAKGLISHERAEIEKLKATQKRLQGELKAEKAQLESAGSDKSGKVSVESEKLRQSILTKSIALLKNQQQIEQAYQSQVLSAELKKIGLQQRSLELSNSTLTVEQQKLALFDRQVSAYDALIASKQRESRLQQDRGELQVDKINFLQSSGALRIEGLQRVKELISQALSSETNDAERRLISQEISSIGYKGRLDELSIVKAIAKEEEAQRQLKINALAREQELQRQNLASEIEQTQLAAQRSQLAAKSAISLAQIQSQQGENQSQSDLLKAREDLARAKADAAKAKSPDEKSQSQELIKFSQQALNLAEKRLGLVTQAGRFSVDQARQQAQFSQEEIAAQEESLRIKAERLNLTQSEERAKLNAQNNTEAFTSKKNLLEAGRPQNASDKLPGGDSSLRDRIRQLESERQKGFSSSPVASTLDNSGSILPQSLLKALSIGRFPQIQPIKIDLSALKGTDRFDAFPSPLQSIPRPAGLDLLPAKDNPSAAKNQISNGSTLNDVLQPILPKLDLIIKLLKTPTGGSTTNINQQSRGDRSTLDQARAQSLNDLNFIFSNLNV